MLTFLVGLAAHLGPLALAGGPVGVAVAWVGSLIANKTAKLVAILLGLGLLLATAVAVTVHWQHLERDSAAYKALSAETTSIERRLGCDFRPVDERGLSACMAARDRDVAQAAASEIARQRVEAAQEQAMLDRQNAALDADRRASEQAIAADAVRGDGPVPQVLLNAWARMRADRGVK